MNLKNIIKKYSKYIPSKKFATITTICLVVSVGLFIFFRISAKEKFIAKNNLALETGKLTINELVQKDSDNDGIPDWEESLWGTDKNNPTTFNGIADATYVENKKKELKIEDSKNDQNLTETDKFAREFFSSFTAMKESGQVDNNTINNMSNALGQKIIDPMLIDLYTENNIKISNDNSDKEQKKYYANMKNLFEIYKSEGLGDELNIINNALASNNTTGKDAQPKELLVIADAYQNFASKATEISVPKILAQYHLRIINSANNTGISVRNMSELMTDPVVGLSGLSQYQKYSDELIGAVEDLDTTMP